MMTAWSKPIARLRTRLNDSEFQAAKAFDDSVLLTESALGGEEVAIAFRPRDEWPKAFKFYRLHK